MELAGLACAQTVASVYDVKKHNRVLVCCGPGNQVGEPWGIILSDIAGV